MKVAAETKKKDKRAAPVVAAPSNGKPNVVPFPTLLELPEPDMPLGEAGRKEFDRLIRQLFDAGRLTQIAYRRVVTVALLVDSMHRLLAKGKPVPASYANQIQRALGELEGEVGKKPIAGPEASRQSRFARNGFANRSAGSRSNPRN